MENHYSLIIITKTINKTIVLQVDHSRVVQQFSYEYMIINNRILASHFNVQSFRLGCFEYN